MGTDKTDRMLVVPPVAPFDTSTRAQADFEARPTFSEVWEREAVARVDLAQRVDPMTTSFHQMGLRMQAKMRRG